MARITAHCMVKNEEVFIKPVLESVIGYVEKIIVFDTGSSDDTVKIINEVSLAYPGKILFEEKGECNKKVHTKLRQEMVDRTETEWFMILDGDEVWPKKIMDEAIQAIENNPDVDCLVAPFHLCVGDVFHEYKKEGQNNILGKNAFHYPRFMKKVRGVHWQGDYNEDVLRDEFHEIFIRKDKTIFLKNQFWHMTHLRRSHIDDKDYSSGGTRAEKRRPTYLIIGKKISEAPPDPLNNKEWKLGFFRSFFNFFGLILKQL